MTDDFSQRVIAGLDPAIHLFSADPFKMDARVKPAHDNIHREIAR